MDDRFDLYSDLFHPVQQPGLGGLSGWRPVRLPQRHQAWMAEVLTQAGISPDTAAAKMDRALQQSESASHSPHSRTEKSL